MSNIQSTGKIIGATQAQYTKAASEATDLQAQFDSGDSSVGTELLGKIREMIDLLDRTVTLLRDINTNLGETNEPLLDLEFQWVALAAQQRARYDLLLRRIVSLKPRL